MFFTISELGSQLAGAYHYALYLLAASAALARSWRHSAAYPAPYPALALLAAAGALVAATEAARAEAAPALA